MKKLISFLVILLLLTPAITVRADFTDFTDLQEHWAKEFILAATARGIFSGNPDGTFAPERTLNRAELAVVVSKTLGLPQETTPALSFRDSWQIPSWAQEAVAAVVDVGLLQGREDSTFAPLASVTREEVAVVLVRALGLSDKVKGYNGKPGFTDDGQISDWALPSVGVAREIELFSGDTQGRFLPRQPLKRGEAARIVMGFLQLKDKYVSPPTEHIDSDATTTTATVTANLNFRSQPGTSSEKIGLLPAGTVVSVSKSVQVDGETWLKVTYNGQQGYIAAAYTTVNSPNPIPSPEKTEQLIATTTTTLNVRSGPGTSFTRLGSLSANTSIPVEQEVYQLGETWLEITYEGKTAFIAGQYATLTRIPLKGTKPEKDKEAPQVKEPPQENPPVPEIKPGEKPTDTAPHWKAFTELDSQGLRKVISGQRVLMATLESTLNVRSAPNTAADIIGGLPTGTQIRVEQRHNSGAEEWLEIVYQGKKGYIAGWYTNTREAYQDIPAPGVNEIAISRVNNSLYTLTVRGSEPLGGKLKTDKGKITLQLKNPEFPTTLRTTLGSGPFNSLWAAGDTITLEHQLQQVEAKFRGTNDGSLQLLLSLNPDDPNLGQSVGWEPASRELAGKTIMLDAGHGGADPGTIGTTYGTKEKDVVLDITLKTAALLERGGAQVVLTRSGDTSLSLQSRVDMSNSVRPHLFVSIHADHNDNPAIGGSTLYYSSLCTQKAASYKLAGHLMDSLEATLGLRRVGIRDTNFFVNRYNTVPAVLVETAFLSNPTEEGLMRQDSFRQKAAEAIAKGIVKYLQN